MKNRTRIEKIRQFIDLAQYKAAQPTTPTESLISLIVVLTGHIGELLTMMDEPEDDRVSHVNLDAALRAALYGPTIPREEPRPILTADVVADYDEYGMFNFTASDESVPYWPDNPPTAPRVIEPTADEILKHTRSCDFRRGLKNCTCVK